MTFATEQPFADLVRAVRDAGDVLLSLWPGASPNQKGLSISEKADGSLVSEADMRSNDILMEALSSLYPGDCIFSEEVAPDLAALRASRRTWIIDPLDGTSAFLEGRDDFSILVGLAEDHRASMGILYLVARGQMLLAQRGRGAFCNGNPLRVSSAPKARPGKVYFRHCVSPIEGLASPHMDSGLALAQVAMGELDGVVLKMKTHKEWDLAAPMAILNECGARVSDERGGEIPLGVGEIGFRYLVVSNGLVHDELLAVASSIE